MTIYTYIDLTETNARITARFHKSQIADVRSAIIQMLRCGDLKAQCSYRHEYAEGLEHDGFMSPQDYGYTRSNDGMRGGPYSVPIDIWNYSAIHNEELWKSGNCTLVEERHLFQLPSRFERNPNDHEDSIWRWRVTLKGVMIAQRPLVDLLTKRGMVRARASLLDNGTSLRPRGRPSRDDWSAAWANLCARAALDQSLLHTIKGAKDIFDEFLNQTHPPPDEKVVLAMAKLARDAWIDANSKPE